jgi:hypothetical protein
VAPASTETRAPREIRSSGRPLLRRVFLAAQLTVASAIAVPVAGQEAALQSLVGVLRGLPSASFVRITTAEYRLEAAVIADVDATTVTLRSEDLSVAVPLADIRGVDVRDRHRLQGLLWGGASGAVLGSVLGVIVGSWDCIDPGACQDAENRGGLRGGLAGGAAGGLVGFVIGRHSFYWRPVFP